ncbi:MAG TPA: TrbC/VirB2 family protein [Sphingomicrobium sp.]|nr:TrbC/VirB2 family protein [Sphingomicrobium sp.]
MYVSDPSGSNPLTAALEWLQGTLLGSFATSIAVIALALIGFLMLSGRVDVRRAVQVVLGCFIIFGASTIANGILLAVSGASHGPDLAQAPPPPPPQFPAPVGSQPTSSSPFDPYAGAAFQQQ